MAAPRTKPEQKPADDKPAGVGLPPLVPPPAPEVPAAPAPQELPAPAAAPELAIRLVTLSAPLSEQIEDGRIPRFIDAHHKRLTRAEGYALRALFDALVARGERLDSRPVTTYYDAVRWLLKQAAEALDAQPANLRAD